MTRIGYPRSALTVLLDALERELLTAPAAEVRDAWRGTGRARSIACQEVRALLDEAIAASEDGSAATPALFLHRATVGTKGEDRPCKPEKTASVGRTARLDGRRGNDGFRRSAAGG